MKDKRKSLSTTQVTDDPNSLFRVKHHSVGDDVIADMSMFVAAKNSSVSFQDRGRFYVQPIVERTLHSGSPDIEGSYCINAATVNEVIAEVVVNQGITVGPYK